MPEHALQLVLDATCAGAANFGIAILIAISLILLVFVCREQSGIASQPRPDDENIE
jgi:hypothetical protein